MSENSPAPGKAIIYGSIIIAVGIFAGALVLPDGGGTQPAKPNGVAPTATAGNTAVRPAPAGQGGRYQIVRTENGSAWRLDTETGEITLCRAEADRMICAKSTAATELPKASPEQLAKERAEKRQQKKTERTEIMDRFFSFFERILRFAERESEKQAPAGQGENEFGRPL